MDFKDIDWFPVFLSLRVALLATFNAVTLGVLLAYFLSRRPFFGREVIIAITNIPLVLPPTVLGYYLLLTIGRDTVPGVVCRKFCGGDLVFTWYAAVIASTIASMPFVVQMMRTALEGVSREMEEAATLDGASEYQVFRAILLPMTARSLGVGATLGFARAIGEFGATLMVAGNIPSRTQTLPIAIYEYMQSGREKTALFLVLLISLFAVLVSVMVHRLGRGSLMERAM
ncbi:MAG: molybdate ABC transporter permease subunit [Armatimonadetes bacterium]|nr:molybdate ABC transporter permease subunit [Armatimonadota bacterium]